MAELKAGRILRADTISEAWNRGLEVIWEHGAVITDERGSKIREFLNLMVVVEEPYRDRIPKGTSWNEERLAEYAKQLISGENTQGFEYTYGQRLRKWNDAVDQIDYVIKKLRANPQSRRATAVTWIPSVDTKVEEVPCMIVDDFKIREGKLHLTVLFRSHDFAGAYPANLYGLSELLAYTAKSVGVPPGRITTVSVSAHIYEHDWDWVEKVVR